MKPLFGIFCVKQLYYDSFKHAGRLVLGLFQSGQRGGDFQPERQKESRGRHDEASRKTAQVQIQELRQKAAGDGRPDGATTPDRERHQGKRRNDKKKSLKSVVTETAERKKIAAVAAIQPQHVCIWTWWIFTAAAVA